MWLGSRRAWCEQESLSVHINAAVTAAGCGFAGVLIKLFTSDFGQNLLRMLVEFFLKMVGIG